MSWAKAEEGTYVSVCTCQLPIAITNRYSVSFVDEVKVQKYAGETPPEYERAKRGWEEGIVRREIGEGMGGPEEDTGRRGPD